MTSLPASSAQARDFDRNAEPQRHPDPDVVATDPERFKAKDGHAAIQRPFTGHLCAERPTWGADMGRDGQSGFADGIGVDIDGVRIGQIRLPEICANACCGEPRCNRLFAIACSWPQTSRSMRCRVSADGAHGRRCGCHTAVLDRSPQLRYP